ncbi:MAG: MMPL family transporter [Firmicutes bacterium]|nr:MMPL family transporter [Bacillota bacterium]
MKKLSEWTCKHRILILIVSLLLLIPTILGIKATKINYDILVYLPDDIETMKGQEILTNDFHMGAFSIALIDHMETKDLVSLENQIRKIDGVEKVIGTSDMIGTTIPKEMLPDSIQNKIEKDGFSPILITFKDSISDEKTIEAIETLRETTSKACHYSGMSSVVKDTGDIANSEIAVYVIVAVIFCGIVLLFALDSYVVPVLLLCSIGFSILYNMGTNVMFGEISYITKAISAVLQLGVTMDFSIFLYHAYQRQKRQHTDKLKAMEEAIVETMRSVVGSSLTTIAGFLALCTMTLTLGSDIGLVMAKGVLLGVVSVITIFPALLLVFDKWIEKTKHRELFPKFDKLRKFNIKHYQLIAILFVILLVPAYYGQMNTKVYYNLNKAMPASLPSSKANELLKDKFDIVSPELILVFKDMDAHRLNQMLSEIESVKGIDFALSLSKINEIGLPEEALPNELLSMLKSDKYQMVIVNSTYETATPELNHQIKEMNQIVKKYDKKAILAGEGPLMKDLVEISDQDFKNVNTASIGIIFILMVFVLKSISLPIILVATIEFAIFLNMSVPYYTGVTIPFIASIVIGTIQLGATVDYAILMTTKYREARRSGQDKIKSADYALKHSMTSIMVSGLCFFAATCGVGMYSKLEMIGSLCTLISRGAIISMIVVITVLPALLIIFDKVIEKTTWDKKLGKKVIK